jgi:ornithine cyclodeaminase/alanine dehydrogenase-like protein (mu-crystallin family)
MTMPTLLLSREDVARLLEPADYLDAVAAAFRASKEGRAHSPPPLHIQVPGGGFHAKGAFMDAMPSGGSCWRCSIRSKSH